jgi:hypothetical protein
LFGLFLKKCSEIAMLHRNMAVRRNAVYQAISLHKLPWARPACGLAVSGCDY